MTGDLDRIDDDHDGRVTGEEWRRAFMILLAIYDSDGNTLYLFTSGYFSILFALSFLFFLFFSIFLVDGVEGRPGCIRPRAPAIPKS